MSILAVTGITGHTGRFFLQELFENRFNGTVRCLLRETSNTAALDDSGLNVEKVVGNLTDGQSLDELTRGADVVLHITNIRYSLAVLRACIKNHVSRVVLVHTTGIYSQHKMAAGEYQQIEMELFELLKGTEIDVTILRPTMIFGDLCDHNIHQFIKMVDKLPFMPEINRGTGRLQPVNARDLGKAYWQAVQASHLPEIGYTVSGERSITMHEVFELIGTYLGKKMVFVSCPMRLGVFFARALKFVTGGKRDFVEKVLRMGEDRDYDHDAATRDFGYMPEPFEMGLKREVEEYKRVFYGEKA